MVLSVLFGVGVRVDSLIEGFVIGGGGEFVVGVFVC